MSWRWKVRVFAVLLMAAAWTLLTIRLDMLDRIFNGPRLPPASAEAARPPGPEEPPPEIKAAGRLPAYLCDCTKTESWFVILSTLGGAGALIWSVWPPRRRRVDRPFQTPA